MGISDRDYSRITPPKGSRSRGIRRSPLAGLASFSANSILIAICCLVFFIDERLAKVPVQLTEWQVNPAQVEAFNDIRRARSETTSVRLPANSQGVGIVLVYPGRMPAELVLQVDPIAQAQYLLVSPLRAWLQFTTAQAIFSLEPDGSMQGLQFWRFVGYGFLHVGLAHLFFNMMGLWIFGGIVEERFGRRRFLAIFGFSVVTGALLFLILNALGIAFAPEGGISVPGLLSSDPYTPLVGASAGVYGIILAAAWLAPDEEIMLFFILPIKLRILALFLIGLSVWTLLSSGQNAGGEAAHLGGAIAGWWIASRPHLLDDFFDLLGRRLKPARVVDTREIDRILDKVREQGLGALTERERSTLRNAGDTQRKADDARR